MNLDRKKLIGVITEIEASRARAKAETTHQSEILKKAKADGFDTKAIRKVLQRRAMSTSDRESLDYAVEQYEIAMGSLARALEAVTEGRMSRREAAEHYGVPRGALGTVAAGPKTGFSSQSPDHNPETGEIHAAETADRGRGDARLAEAEPVGPVPAADEGQAADAAPTVATIATIAAPEIDLTIPDFLRRTA